MGEGNGPVTITPDTPPVTITPDQQGDKQQGHGLEDAMWNLAPDIAKDLKSSGKGLLDFAKGLVQHPMWPGSYDPENPIVKATASQFDSSMQAKQRMMEAAKNGDAMGAAQHAAGMVPVANQVDAAMTQYQQEPTHENLAHVLTAAIPAFVPTMMRGLGKVGEAGDADEAAEAAPKAGRIEQVMKGKEVEQAPAQAAVREAAGSGEPSLRELLTKPIADSESQASDLYKQIDQTAGFDVKAMNQKLQNISKEIRQLTDTPEDIAKEAKLEQARTGLMDKLEKSGVDPKLIKQADMQWRQTRAMQAVEKRILKNPNIVEGDIKFGKDETIKVDETIKEVRKLQQDKYGNRIEQWLGKDGESDLLSKLYNAQKQGVHALKTQNFAKWVAKYVVPPAAAAAGGAIYEATK